MRKMLAIGICAAAGWLGCGGNSGDESANTVVDEPQADYTQDTLLYRDAAEALIVRFQRELKSELMAAMRSSGAVGAISVCGAKAPEVQAAHSANTWAVQRVSEKFRNPDNRADTTELQILSRFSDTVSPQFMQLWSPTDSVTTYSYYRPIRTMPLCLNCHGDLQTLASGVMDALKKRYPLDRATGYKSDELRGMFVVTAAWPEGIDGAMAILNDSIAEPTSETDTL